MRRKLLGVVLILTMLIVCAMSFSACRRTETDSTNMVDFSQATVLQEIEGFGASSAWWSQIVGGSKNAEEIANKLYSEDGLAMNIYRYNIGGGSKDVKDKDCYWEQDRLTESFLKGENYHGTTHDELLAFVSDVNNYDFTKDANAQRQLKLSYDLGCIDNVILFVNSPHYLMTKNGICRSSNGADDVDNLSEKNFDIFAKYLMVILKHFVDEGYPVTYLSPINEPQWDWSDNKQEGCHYEPATCAKCLNVVYNTLKEFNGANGTDVKLDGFESGNWNTKKHGNISRITDYLDAMQAYPYFKELDHVSFHSYSSAGQKKVRTKFMKKIADYNIQVSCSEYCQMSAGVNLKDFKSAQYLALVMSYDFSVLHSCTWEWWIAMSNESTYNYEDGLMYTNWWAENDDVRISPRYYTMMHYSKFVQPGAKYLEITLEDKVSHLSFIDKWKTWYNNDGEKAKYADDLYNVFKNPDGSIVIVYDNITDDSYTWNFKEEIASYTSYTSTDGKYMQSKSGEKIKSYTFPANSITTVVINPKN